VVAGRSLLLPLFIAASLAAPATAEVRPRGEAVQRVKRRDRARPVARRAALPPRRTGSIRGRLLASPASSASARLDLIRSAQGEINTSTFIFTDDRLGRIALAELRAAARSGKKVRLLVDGTGNGLSREAMAHLLEEGIEVGIYNRFSARKLLRPVRISYRLHDKLLIVDRKHLVVGGRNVEQSYFGLSKPGEVAFDDVDAYVEGEPAASANDYFMDLWDGPLVEQLRRDDLRVSPDKVARYGEVIDKAARVSARRPVSDFRHRWKDEPVQRMERVEFLHENPRTLGNRDRRLQRRILRVLDEAESEVEIHTPYLVPDRDFLGAVARARERGVTVRIITNSLKTAKGHELLAQWAYESQLRGLARAGAEVWEVKGPRTLHAKTVVADRRQVYIGSYNMDQRSRKRQKEVGILADAPGLAEGTLAHGVTLRTGGMLVARRGALTAAKRTQCGRACTFFARFVYGPLSRVTGLYGHL
jgi:putative cardiolipin synthase